MRIVCPSCAAVYDVPEPMLASGPRAVRCARCGTEWSPEAERSPGHETDVPPARPEPPPPAVPEPVAPLVAKPPERAASRLSGYRARTGRRRGGEEPGDEIFDDSLDERPPPRDDETTLRSRRSAMIGWVLSIVLLVALAVAAVGWRTQVIAAWPPSQRLYGVLGLN